MYAPRPLGKEDPKFDEETQTFVWVKYAYPIPLSAVISGFYRLAWLLKIGWRIDPEYVAPIWMNKYFKVWKKCPNCEVDLWDHTKFIEKNGFKKLILRDLQRQVEELCAVIHDAPLESDGNIFNHSTRQKVISTLVELRYTLENEIGEYRANSPSHIVTSDDPKMVDAADRILDPLK